MHSVEFPFNDCKAIQRDGNSNIFSRIEEEANDPVA
jgi:hypothetical protein